jgi:hypothetical protein
MFANVLVMGWEPICRAQSLLLNSHSNPQSLSALYNLLGLSIKRGQIFFLPLLIPYIGRGYSDDARPNFFLRAEYVSGLWAGKIY